MNRLYAACTRTGNAAAASAFASALPDSMMPPQTPAQTPGASCGAEPGGVCGVPAMCLAAGFDAAAHGCRTDIRPAHAGGAMCVATPAHGVSFSSGEDGGGTAVGCRTDIRPCATRHMSSSSVDGGTAPATCASSACDDRVAGCRTDIRPTAHRSVSIYEDGGGSATGPRAAASAACMSAANEVQRVQTMAEDELHRRLSLYVPMPRPLHLWLLTAPACLRHSRPLHLWLHAAANPEVASRLCRARAEKALQHVCFRGPPTP